MCGGGGRARVCVHFRVCGGCPGVCMCARACSFAYPACNAHAPCCVVICGLSGPTTFFDIISIKGTIFGKKVTEDKMCVLTFSASLI